MNLQFGSTINLQFVSQTFHFFSIRNYCHIKTALKLIVLFTHLICVYSLKHISYFTNRLYYYSPKVYNFTPVQLFILCLNLFHAKSKSERKCLFILKHPIFCLLYSSHFFWLLAFDIYKGICMLSFVLKIQCNHVTKKEICWKNWGECKRINN